jgi:exopolyphosphatase/guanosine-5'-triphosphate,3'-diphosphate pyrophosphatase
MVVGAVDVGSYSARLTVARVGGGKIEILRELGRITSLSEGLLRTGYLREDRIRETLRVLKEFRDEIEKFGCERVKAVATEALRRAKNSGDFLALVKKETGLELEIISPQEEGRLAFLAVAYSLRPDGTFLVVDQGGGSTEFVFGEGMNTSEIISFDFGIVNLTERFIRNDPPSRKEIEELRAFVAQKIKRFRKMPHTIVGLGGTITTLVALEKNIYPYDPSAVHGSELSSEAVERWLDILSSIPLKERSKKFPQIEDRRAKVIVPGIAMYAEVLKHFRKETLLVSDWGVKQGLIVRMILEDSV